MKSLIILIVITTFFSCSQSISKYELIGSWIEIKNERSNEERTTEHLVFQSNNIAKLVLLKDGKPVSTTNFTYEVDEENKLLITEWDNRTMSSEIVKLHNDQLFLKRPSTNTTIRYKRMDEN